VNVPNQKIAKRLKCFSFFFFRSASSKLQDSLMMALAAFYTEQCATPLLFHNLSLTRHLKVVTH